MQTLFLSILKMSITAGYVFLFVIAVRFLIKKAPKVFSYILWAVVFIRLICPFSFESPFSIFNLFKTSSAENNIPVNISNTIQPEAASAGVSSIKYQVLEALPAETPAVSVDPIQIIIFIASIIWALGVLLLIIYSVISYISLKRKVKTAVLIKDNIFECENIDTPFVLGIIKPKIYLPVYLSETEKSYILKHEQIHIKRFDYIIKPFAFLALCIHWFNPIVWISFILMNKDMEMSCDEKVIKIMGAGIKKDYSTSLLSLAVNKKLISGCPIAFVESNAKSRIKNILNYKKPAFWVVALTVIIIGAISVGLISDPQIKAKALEPAFLNINETIKKAKEQETLIMRNDKGGTLISGEEFSRLLSKESKNWKDDKVLSPYKSKPAFTVYIDANENHELRFYKSNPEKAMLINKGKFKCYKVTKNTYDTLFFMYIVRSYIIPSPVMSAVFDGKRTKLQSVDDVPNVDVSRRIKVGNLDYYLYEKDGKYYCESPYMFINEIPKNVYTEAIKSADLTIKNKEPEISSNIIILVENNLKIIMSSPKESSNPEDYIKANRYAYENILKYGDEGALSYMLSQIKGSKEEGLKEQIMMHLCKEILGVRNNVTDENLSPKEWYRKLNIKKKVGLPDFVYKGSDPIEKIVYNTEAKIHKSSRGAFTIVAPHIFGTYKEGDRLKIFVTTFSSSYLLYDKVLTEEEGSVVPAAITYIKNQDGTYTLEKYEQAQDGSEFAPSIKKYCTMPLSGKKIIGLSRKILNHYKDYKDIIKLERQNLIQHLKANNLSGITLYKSYEKEKYEKIN